MSEEIDETSSTKKISETSGLRDCIICHYGYFLHKNFRFDLKIWKVCNAKRYEF